MSPYESNTDDVKRRLERVAEWASGPVMLTELLPPEFVSKHTPFPDLQAFLDAGGVSIGSAEDLEAKEPQLDEMVRQHTRFPSWRDMAAEAVAERIRGELET